MVDEAAAGEDDDFGVDAAAAAAEAAEEEDMERDILRLPQRPCGGLSDLFRNSRRLRNGILANVITRHHPR